ncbi:MAG TPA: tetratricopeptide repeat protein [Steroidobacteraceae bacterium]|nr:tetratricopeptide repeat protein [Steroidobacteraceae bacterium]
MENSAESPADAQFCRALSLHRQSRFEEASLAYEEVLRRQPRHVQALTFLSVIAFERREPARALELTARALEVDPASAAIHLMQGHVRLQLRHHEAAVASYERALALKPDLPDAYWHRGNALAELGRHHAAVESYDAALRLDPRRAEVHASRGLALSELRQFQEALASFDCALAIDSASAQAHLSRAIALRELRRLEEALASQDRAIALRPDYALAHANRGNLLSELESFDAALASYDAALCIDPANVDALCNRGNLLAELLRLDEALASFDRALSIRSDYAQAHFSKAFVCLVLGDWSKGWREFEWRFRNEHCVTSREARSFSQPQWRGEPVAGKTILLHCEQGLGDTIQFCRFAKCVADLGARVVLEAPAALVRLLTSLSGVAQLLTRGEAVPAFDLHCPLLSLPLALNITPTRVPAEVPYLRSDAGRVKHWKARLGERTRARVGLVWSGGFRPEQPELWAVNRRRNVPLAKLGPLRHPGIEFYSLQKGQHAETELADAVARGWDGPDLLDLTSELEDFADTAALIEQLDLVITVDTATAHLAGALGKPVWILNRFDTCWRWLLERSDTPWYPTARLYRQERRGDWDGVIRRVRADLEELACTASSRTCRQRVQNRSTSR